MQVYVVELGEDCEGSQILGIYSTVEKARAAAIKQMQTYHKGEWEARGNDYWHAGCDYLSIVVWTVQ